MCTTLESLYLNNIESWMWRTQEKTELVLMALVVFSRVMYVVTYENRKAKLLAKHGKRGFFGAVKVFVTLKFLNITFQTIR